MPEEGLTKGTTSELCCVPQGGNGEFLRNPAKKFLYAT